MRLSVGNDATEKMHNLLTFNCNPLVCTSLSLSQAESYALEINPKAGILGVSHVLTLEATQLADA
jgi:hypothetical protein